MDYTEATVKILYCINSNKTEEQFRATERMIDNLQSYAEFRCPNDESLLGRCEVLRDAMNDAKRKMKQVVENDK